MKNDASKVEKVGCIFSDVLQREQTLSLCLAVVKKDFSPLVLSLGRLFISAHMGEKTTVMTAVVQNPLKHSLSFLLQKVVNSLPISKV